MYFTKGCDEELTFPLAEIPATSSGLVNPCVGENNFNVPAPLYAGDGGFSESLMEVVSVRQDTLANRWPAWFFEAHGIDPEIPEPLVHYGRIVDAQSAASAVHMDSPVDLMLILLEWLNKDAMAKFAAPRYPNESGHTDFLSNPVGIIGDGAANVRQALEECFRVKYFYGVARPEEVTGIGPKFTHYPEGCPSHCSYTAGHSAAAGAVHATLVAAYDLTEDQEMVVANATKHFGMYRTLAGVHYQEDNREGWRLGVAVAQGLPTVCDVTF